MDALKTIIKSIVISYPGHMTVDQLQRDYKKLEGRVLQYRNLGYESIDQMLRCAFGDVIKVYGQGPKASVVPVNNNKSEHIMRLVNEPRTAKKTRHLPRSRYKNKKYGHFNSSERHGQNRNICLTRSQSKCLYHSHNIKHVQNMSSIKEEDSRAITLDILLRYQKEVAENQIKNSVSNTSTGNEDNKYECDEVAATNLESCQVHDLEEDISDLNISGISVTDITKKDDDLASLESCSDIFFKPKKNTNNIDEAIPDFAFNYRIFLLDFPAFTVKFGTKIKPFEMPQNITVDSVISIYISEVHNPYRFWFHETGQSNELDELMNIIEFFYERTEQTLTYNILPEQIQTGQVCVAKFNGFWHRAEILQNYLTDNKVQVFFMDYGTVFDVEICNIKYLRTEFAELPAFALRGCLAEISPLSLHWSMSSSLAFLSMCCERLVHAKVCEIDSVNKVYYLTVCDTHDERVVQINRELIDLNHALKSSEWSESRRLDRPRLRHKREDYPTFDMLEKGDYPTLNELIDMESNGIYYESITDKKIYHPHILNFEKQTAELLHDLPFLLLSNNPFASDIIEELKSNSENQKTKKC